MSARYFVEQNAGADAQRAEAERIIKEVAELVGLPAWKRFSTEMGALKERYKQEMMKAQDPAKIMAAREGLIALMRVTDWVEVQKRVYIPMARIPTEQEPVDPRLSYQHPENLSRGEDVP